MSTPFVSDYLKAAADSSDRPANPVTDPGTSEEMIAFRFEADTQTLVMWDPVNEEYLTISFGGASLADTDDLPEGSTNQYFTNERVDDRVNDLLVAGTNITLTYNDVAGTLTVDAAGGYTDEMAQDAVGGMLVDGNTINFTYADGTPSITAEMYFRGARVKKSIDQTAANYTTETAVAWDAEDYDTNALHDNVTANTQLVIPAGYGGYWEFGGFVRGTADTANTSRQARLRLDGTTYIGSNHNFDSGSTDSSLHVNSGPVLLTAGQYVEFMYKTETDTSITINAAESRFWARFLGYAPP